MSERDQLEQAIAYIESQRTILGDDVANSSIMALQEKLATLTPTAHADRQRKQATVLFADVSGFTALSETMDAEEVGEMMNHLWQRLDQTILEQGGHIDKHMGDGVMALWGTEAAREDDPERAIRAALSIQQQVHSFNAELDRSVPLQVRIGVNTGWVLLGEVGTTAEYTAMGDTVNLASRLEEAAPADGIMISHDTYRHVRGIFDVQPLGPQQLRGRRDAVAVYLVQRAKERAFRMGTRGVEGIETRMVGREPEMAQLQQALLNTNAGQLQWVTVAAEAGMGKSRLLHEFEKWLELHTLTVRYYKGRASLEMHGLPYTLIRDLFAFRFLIQESDPVQVVREKMEEGIGEALAGIEDLAAEPRMQAHFIGQLLGFDFSDSPYLQGITQPGEAGDAQQLRDRALIYLHDYFRAVASERPVLILLEDLHWADDSSLDVLQHLAQSLADQRVLIIGATRPALFERRPGWGQDHLLLQLPPLSQQDSAHLVAEILQRVDQLPVELHDLVVNGAEGNPFYIEELIKMLIEDGVIIKGQDTWRVEPARLNAARIPPTLVGVLQSRLDSLPAEERAILQRASVVGRTFWDRAVAYISAAVGELGDAEVTELLQALRDREMVFNRPTSLFADADEYIFKHAVLRDVTYESVLKRVRRLYHGWVAEWLIEHSGERAEEYTGLIADHLELAGETERAVAYLRRAGEQAAARFAHAEAITYFTRALGLLATEARSECFELLLARERVYSMQGNRQAQRQDLAALEQLAQELAIAPTSEDETKPATGRLHAVSRQIEAALRRATYAEETGDFAAAMAKNQEAIRLADESLSWASDALIAIATPACGAACLDVSRLQAEGYLQWGRALWRQGEYEKAQAELQHALELARAITGRPATAPTPKATLRQARMVEANGLRNLGNVHWYTGNYEQARTRYEQALAICQAIGNRRGQSAAVNNLGTVCAKLGRHAEAKAYYEQSLAIDREIGNPRGISRSLSNLGSITAGQGDYDQARSCYKESMRICRETGDIQGLSGALNNLGIIYDQLGDYTAAREHFEEALEIRRQIGAQQGEGEGLSDLAMLHHHLGDDQAAVTYSRQALPIIQKLGDPFIEGFVWIRLGHALLGLGQIAEAEKAYRRSLELRRQVGQQELVVETLAGLARVALAEGSTDQALAQVKEILKNLPTTSLEGTEEPLRIYLTCYQVLHAAGDPRNKEILRTAHGMLQERAGRITDEEARRSFMQRVAVHREVVQLYEAPPTTPPL